MKKQVISFLAKKLLATHTLGSISYYLCLFMQHNSGLVVTSMHAQMKHILLQNLQDLIPTLALRIIHGRKGSQISQIWKYLQCFLVIFVYSGLPSLKNGCSYSHDNKIPSVTFICTGFYSTSPYKCCMER